MADIAVRGEVIAFTATSLDYQFRVMGGNNLRSVVATDNMGIGVDLEPPLEECNTDTYIGVARNVARERFPLRAVVEDCEDNVCGPDDLGQFGVPERRPENNLDTPLPCSALHCWDDTGCNRAMADAQEERNAMQRLCDEAARLRREFIALAISAAILFAAWAWLLLGAANALAAGGWVGAIVAAILFVAAWAVFATAVWMARRAYQRGLELREKEAEVDSQRRAFERRLVDVEDRCCPGCIRILTTMPC